MENLGWIKLHRKLLTWEWVDNPNTGWLFMVCLMSANHEDKKWRGITIEKGSFITSLPHLAKLVGLSIQSVRTSLSHLKSTGEITVKSTNKYRVIVINNWVDYQSSNRQINRQSTGNQQTTNRQLTANKNNTKNEKNEKNKDIVTFLNLFNKLFNTSYKETPGRTEKLAARLKSFSLQDILDATANLSRSAFHRGKNDRQWVADPDFLIRNDEQVDKWLNTGAAPKRKQPDALLQFAKEHGNKITQI